jgi:hypothetical protein
MDLRAIVSSWRNTVGTEPANKKAPKLAFKFRGPSLLYDRAVAARPRHDTNVPKWSNVINVTFREIRPYFVKFLQLRQKLLLQFSLLGDIRRNRGKEIQRFIAE